MTLSKNKKFWEISQSKTGTALMQVVLLGGFIAAISIPVFQLVTERMHVQQRIRSKAEVDDMLNLLLLNLMNPVTCTTMFNCGDTLTYTGSQINLSSICLPGSVPATPLLMSNTPIQYFAATNNAKQIISINTGQISIGSQIGADITEVSGKIGKIAELEVPFNGTIQGGNFATKKYSIHFTVDNTGSLKECVLHKNPLDPSSNESWGSCQSMGLDGPNSSGDCTIPGNVTKDPLCESAENSGGTQFGTKEFCTPNNWFYVFKKLNNQPIQLVLSCSLTCTAN